MIAPSEALGLTRAGIDGERCGRLHANFDQAGFELVENAPHYRIGVNRLAKVGLRHRGHLGCRHGWRRVGAIRGGGGLRLLGGGRGAADIGGAPASAEEPQAAAATDGADAAPSMAAAEVPAMSQADLRQTVYADPVVRRIFDEFEARLVEVRVQAAAPLAVDSGSRKP